MAEPSAIHIFVSYTSLAEQAEYVPRAFELGQELGYIGPMFLDNLNGCQGLSFRVEVCYNSLIDSDGVPRPVFSAVQMMSVVPIDTGTGDSGEPLPMDDLSDDEGMVPEATEEGTP